MKAEAYEGNPWGKTAPSAKIHDEVWRLTQWSDAHLGVTAKQIMRSDLRTDSVSAARHCTCYVLGRLGYKCREIAAALKIESATVYYALKKIQRSVDAGNEHIIAALDGMRKALEVEDE